MDHLTGVGTTTDRSVRLWWRCPAAASFRLEIEPEGGADCRQVLTVPQQGREATDWTMSVEVPHEVEGARHLAPSTRYRYRLDTDEGEAVGSGFFRTAPAGPQDASEHWSFAVMSCHQPFRDTGEMAADAARMLRVLEPTLEDLDVDYVLLVGDQMYADLPEGKNLHDPDYFRTIARYGEPSLLDCSEDEVLHHFHRRYLQAWKLPELRALQSNRPTYWILDDHEIVDNWGADPNHLEPRWQKTARAARRAFLHYQGAHQRRISDGLPDSFHFHFRWADTATFVTDMRSRRRVEDDRAVVLGNRQLNFGVVDVIGGGPGIRLRFRLFTFPEDDRAPTATVAFDSGEL